MKILHIIYDDVKNPWCGGGGAYRALMINGQIAHEQHEVMVLTGNFPGAKNVINDNVTYKRVGLNTSYLISRISFTILVPFYLKRYQGDIIINDCSFFSPCFADIYSRRPVVNIFHHLMGKHAIRLYKVVGLLPLISEKILLSTVKNVIVPSREIMQELTKKSQIQKISSIPNGISESLFELEQEEKDFILFLGRIDIYMKGIDLLIEAFSNIRNQGKVILKIAGSGKHSDIRKLKELIGNFHLEKNIEYLGRVTEEEKYELLRSCMFLVMPSRFEGWGITAVEANAAGKAVLGTDIKALSEAVINNKTALLIESENKDKLTKGIDFLIENRESRTALGREGKKRAKNFSWRSIAQTQLEFYESVYKKM